MRALGESLYVRGERRAFAASRLCCANLAGNLRAEITCMTRPSQQRPATRSAFRNLSFTCGFSLANAVLGRAAWMPKNAARTAQIASLSTIRRDCSVTLPHARAAHS